RGIAAVTSLPDYKGIARVKPGDERIHLWSFSDDKSPLPPPILSKGPELLAGDWEFYAFLAFSPDGKWLAAGLRGSQDAERPVHLWDLPDGKLPNELGPPRVLGRQPGNCTALAFTPDSRCLLAFSRDRDTQEERLVMWDVVSGQERKRFNLPAREGSRTGDV